MPENIHPTAIIDPAAQISTSAKIGPYCVVGPDVTLEDGVVLAAHVYISGVTKIGARSRIAPFCSLGTPPQSNGYKGEKTSLSLGVDCDIREHVTMNTGTVGGGGKTVLGDRALIMVASHIAHDCIIGNDVTFANNVMLGGHTLIGNRVVFGGLSGCHQFSRIGEGAMIGGLVGIRQDVIPFGLVGRDAMLGGLNIIGLKRRGASRTDLQEIRKTTRAIFFGDGSFEERRQHVIDNPPENPLAALIVAFLAESAKRPIMKFGRGVLMDPAGAE
jgi:UDP-N-acetylglucosamine acyltransferase